MTDSEKIQAVINTLENLDIRPTYDNTNRLLGVYQVLNEVKESIEKGADDGKTKAK